MRGRLENSYLDILKTAYGMSIILYLAIPFFGVLTLFLPVIYLKFKFSRYNLQNKLIEEHYRVLFTSLTCNMALVAVGWILVAEGYEIGLLIGLATTVFYMVRIILQKQKIPEHI